MFLNFNFYSFFVLVRQTSSFPVDNRSLTEQLIVGQSEIEQLIKNAEWISTIFLCVNTGNSELKSLYKQVIQEGTGRVLL